jgi:hypothetical protein
MQALCNMSLQTLSLYAHVALTPMSTLLSLIADPQAYSCAVFNTYFGTSLSH